MVPDHHKPEAEADMEQIKDLVLAIARAVVDDPEQVKVNIIEGSNSLVLELSVSKQDVGKVIGKQGRTADALRVILSAASVKLKKRCTLEIID
jgi:predicted RNA-binding protein YlqC (UPF0109 family)